MGVKCYGISLLPDPRLLWGQTMPAYDVTSSSVQTRSDNECMSGGNSSGSVAQSVNQNVDSDIVVAILRAFNLVEEMGGSHKNLMDIVAFGRDLYCKGDSETSVRWSTSWTSCIKILKNAGYNEPVADRVCLNKSHPHLWSVLRDATDTCKYCHKVGKIEFHYLPLEDKVKRWCSSQSFCRKMTAHWRHRESWLYGSSCGFLSEIWDGKRFAELSWFWDPNKQWLLPVKCIICSGVISAEIISSRQHDIDQTLPIVIECPHCYAQFEHSPQYASGDPRNIALIGHWDGWQPVSTSAKHSCGKVHTKQYIVWYVLSMYSLRCTYVV